MPNLRPQDPGPFVLISDTYQLLPLPGTHEALATITARQSLTVKDRRMILRDIHSFLLAMPDVVVNLDRHSHRQHYCHPAAG